MLQIAICDDLETDRIKLENDVRAYLTARREQAELSFFVSGDELLSVLPKQDMQIIFLDVRMPGISGVDVAKRIREMGRQSAIIFTTVSPEYAFTAYEVKASDYLLKPFSRDDVFVALDYAIPRVPKYSGSFEIISERNHITVAAADILYLEVYGHACQLHMKNGRIYTTNQPLRNLTEKVGDSFIRCHKSFCVNAVHVARPAEDAFVMVNGELIPIGAEYEKKARESFFEWSFRKSWNKY